MPDLATLLLFSAAALALLVVPGPAVLYIVARGASQGRQAALVSVAGIHVGTLVHVFAAVAGLSALVVASATAFTTIKLAGAAYLVYLGVDALVSASKRPTELDGDGAGSPSAVPHRSLRRVFADGVVLNILNPKTAVFFLAFVPQFVEVDRGNTAAQLLVLGALFIALGFLTDGVYAALAGVIGDRLRSAPHLERRAARGSGLIYIVLGAITAWTGRSTTTS